MMKKRSIVLFSATLLAIELLDELVCGVREAAWPLIKRDLGLSYSEVGLLLSLPTLIGNLCEPVLGLLGDTSRRRSLIIGGGVAFAVALLLYGVAGSFFGLLFAVVL